MDVREMGKRVPRLGLRTDEMLIEEANALCGSEQISRELRGAALYRELNRLASTALCLSGGGIRSASFSLGVIEALARYPSQPPGATPVTAAETSLLAKFRYLSTVSGGGYLGGFLTSWLAREHLAHQNGWPVVWEKLAGKRDTPDEEPPELAWLRTYSNYLTPQLGIASADFWTAVAIYVRNLLLNWLVVVPFLCALLLFLKLVAIFVAWFSQFDPRDARPSIALGSFAILCVVAALRFTSRERPTHGKSSAGQGSFLGQDPGLMTVASILFVLTIAFPAAEVFAHNELFSVRSSISLSGLVEFAVAGLSIYAISWILSLPIYQRRVDALLDFLWWSISGAVFGALVSLGVFWYFAVPIEGIWHFQPRELLLLICGVPWIFFCKLTAEMMFVGLSSYEDGSDSDREWLGRAAGWYTVLALSWLIIMCLVFVGSTFANDLYTQLSTWLTAGGTSLVTALLGKSRFTPAAGQAKTGIQLSANIALAIAAPVFVAALIVGFSALLDQLIFGGPLTHSASFHEFVVTTGIPTWRAGIWVGIALLLALVTGWVASSKININRFSLHALYRNRLIRTFLGASNPGRATTRSRFTDFDENDNIRAYDLWPTEDAADVWPKVDASNWRPFHIINMALNIVSTRKLAWQERKAEPFTVSPLHSGSSCLGYRYTTTYGDRVGISLGTAMAISGAAASPNMGYHSSTPLALLLTLLNVRLGWWLGNPGPAGASTFQDDGPPAAIKPLLYEMFGLTTDEQDYVYLSDGGHFENLGLYEMVRRRCRQIIVVDAGCDKEFAFEDLGNAIRKIALDLGITIRFGNLDTLRFRADPNVEFTEHQPPFHAVGTIDYPAADDGGVPGTILYLKPAFHSRRIQNVGVRNYAIANVDFPHQSTGDQWFSESQFESYRALGFEMMAAVLNQILQHPNCPINPTLAQIFEIAESI
jgi:hypothetical protein